MRSLRQPDLSVHFTEEGTSLVVEPSGDLYFEKHWAQSVVARQSLLLSRMTRGVNCCNTTHARRQAASSVSRHRDHMW
jgi:hypothetical protein